MDMPFARVLSGQISAQMFRYGAAIQPSSSNTLTGNDDPGTRTPTVTEPDREYPD